MPEQEKQLSKKVYILAGEASGDLHGSNLIRALKSRLPGCTFRGIGGDRMKEAGMDLIYHMKDLAFMGFTEVVRHLPFIKNVMNKLAEELVRDKPTIVILIDYPGFNLRFAPACKKAGIPVFYYISPQIWAWGGGRINKIRKYVDHMAVVFPFEEEIYRSAGVPCTFVGHPLLEVIEPSLPDKKFYSENGFTGNECIIGLLPGSRKQEIRSLLPSMIDAVRLMKNRIPEIVPVIGAADSINNDLYRELTEAGNIRILYGNTYNIMNYADLLLVSSGTATLESAMFAKPMIIMYKVSLFSFLLAKLLVNIEYIGMANIIAGKKVVPELIQFDVLGSKIASAGINLLENKSLYEDTVRELRSVKDKLGTPGASARTANLVIKYMKSNEQ